MAQANEGWTTVDGLQVSGGEEGKDYKLCAIDYTRSAKAGNGKLATGNVQSLCVLTSTPLTVRNVNPAAPANMSIRIDPGVEANVTFAGVNLKSAVPFNIVTNKGGATTKLHLTLADGTQNRLVANADQHAPGLRCGDGTELTIDDGTLNVDVDGNPIVPDLGRIPAGTTFVGSDGVTHTAGTEPGDDRLTLLDSKDAGTLHVEGGYRCAAIGSGPFENAGKMTFNGGDIYAQAWSNGSTNTDNWDYSSGAAIGSGYAGNGVEMTFNGGSIEARGSYHGSGIGAGIWAYNDPNATQGNWVDRTYPFTDYIDSGLSYGSSNTDATKTLAGDIYINGGLLKAYGGYHGNAFGQGCGGWNKDHRIVITGGTLLPDSSEGGGGTYDIGGAQGEVYVLGGSVRLSGENKYQALINGVMSTNSAYGSMDRSTTVMMTKINLAGYETAKDATITLMDSTINGVPYVYGLPHSTDNRGLLYLWLPTNTNGKEVSVTLGLIGSDGAPVATNPFAISQVASGSTLKQYADFTIDPVHLDALYSLTKRYDGIPYGATAPGAVTFTDLANAIASMNIEVANPSGKHITKADAISFQSQLLNAAGEPSGEAITKGTPVDVGTSQILVTTDEYASDANFKNSFWGHRSYFKAVNITPADAQVFMTGSIVEAGTGDKTPIEDDRPIVKPGSTFEFTAKVAPHYELDEAGNLVADGSEAKTCAAPTGLVRFYATWTDDKGVQHEALLGTSTLNPALAPDGTQVVDAHGYRSSTATIAWDPATFASVGLFGGAIPESFSIAGRYVGADTETKPKAYYVNYNEAEGTFPGQQADIGFEGDPVDPADKNIFLQVLHKQDAEAAGNVIAVGSTVSTTVADGSFVLDGRLVDDGGSANAVNAECVYELCDQNGNPIDASDIVDVAADGTIVPKAPGTAYVRVTKPADGVFSELSQVVPVQITSASLIVRDRDGNQQRTYLDIAAGGAVLDQLKATADGGASSGNAWAADAAPAGSTFLGWTDDPSTNRLVGVNDLISGTVVVYPVYGRPAGQPGSGTEVGKTVENVTKGDATATPEVNDTLHYAISAHNTNLDGAWRNVMFMDKLPSGVALVENSVKLVVVEEGPDGDTVVSETPLAKGNAYGDATYRYQGGVLSYKVVNGDGIQKGQSFQVEFDVVIAPEAVGEPIDNDASIVGDAPDGSGDPDGTVTEGGVTDVAGTPEVFDPGFYEQGIVKRAENETNPDGNRTQVEDRIHYELEMSNTLTAVWKGALFYDKIPKGLTLDVDSVVLKTADGTEIQVPSEAYNPTTRVLCVHAGDIPYGSHAVLAYDVVVNAEAIGESIANTGYVFDGGDEGSGTSTTPGTPGGEWLPEDGSVPDGATPSETVYPSPGDEGAPGALPADPDPTVTKSFVNDTHPGSFVEDDILTYKVKLSNAKPNSLWQNVNIRDYMPEGLAFVSGSAALTLPDGTVQKLADSVYNAATRLFVVPIGNLAGGETYVLTYKVTLHHGGVNRADASGTLPDDETRTGAPEAATPIPDPVKPDQNDDTTTDGTDPDTLTKTVVNETRDEGFAPEDVLSYTVRLTNPKEGSVWRNVCIFDYLPDGLLYQKGSMTLTLPDGTVKRLEDAYFDESSRTIEVPIDELRGGQTYMLSYRVGLRPPDPAKPVTNVAEATGTDEPSDPTASITVQVTKPAPSDDPVAPVEPVAPEDPATPAPGPEPKPVPKPLDTDGAAQTLVRTSDPLAALVPVALTCAGVALVVGLAAALAARRGRYSR